MDRDEWKLWKAHLPEILEWMRAEDEEVVPDRVECLEAVETRAFTLDEKTMQRFMAVATLWPYHKLNDKETELIIRVILEAKNGRNRNMRLGETGKRLLKAAEKKHRVPTGYLDPYREIILAELD